MNEARYEFFHRGKAIRPVPGFIPELRALIPDHATSFLEWGAGCSTLLFEEIARVRGGTVVTLDDNGEYLSSVLRAADRAVVKGVSVDLAGPRASQADTGWNYATWPLSLGRAFDFILIDGRRRMECALASLALRHADTVVALHDYRRTRYQIVTRICDVRDGPQFRTLLPL